MRWLASLCAILAICATANAQYVAPYVNVQGTLTNSSGLPAQNATLTFQPNTIFFVAGTATIVTSSQCATDVNGSVVGIGNPQTGPRVSPQYSGTLPPGDYYVQFTWYDQLGNQTLPSPEVRVQTTATGQLNILPPVGNGPPQAVGMDVYIGTTPGGETYQGQTTSLTAMYTQSTTPTTTGTAVPIRNDTPCRVIANDAAWPTGTGYNVSLVDSSGNTLFTYPQMWQFLGPGSTYNLSQGIPYYNGQVTYPVPLLTQPTNHNMQAINGPLSLGTLGGPMYNIVNVGNLGVGTYSPAWGVDVEGSALAGAINAKTGYLVNGLAGTSGQCLASDGSYLDVLVDCVTSHQTLYYQTLDANGAAQTQRPAMNFSSDFALTDSASPAQTNVALAPTGVTAGSYPYANVTVDSKGRVTAISSNTAASAVQLYYRKLLAASVSLPATTPTTLDSITVNAAGGSAPAFPGSGTWRVLVCYSYYGAAGSGTEGESKVTDGNGNAWAFGEGGQFTSAAGANYQACGFSPVTYTGSSAETFTVTAENQGNQTVDTTSVLLGNPSEMNVTIFASN
jgi:hypothetical protein